MCSVRVNSAWAAASEALLLSAPWLELAAVFSLSSSDPVLAAFLRILCRTSAQTRTRAHTHRHRHTHVTAHTNTRTRAHASSTERLMLLCDSSSSGRGVARSLRVCVCVCCAHHAAPTTALCESCLSIRSTSLCTSSSLSSPCDCASACRARMLTKKCAQSYILQSLHWTLCLAFLGRWHPRCAV